jgi:hypothetical protein
MEGIPHGVKSTEREVSHFLINELPPFHPLAEVYKNGRLISGGSGELKKKKIKGKK